MIAFDTDVLTAILLGHNDFVQRVIAIPENEQAVPIIVVEEIIRGRLKIIRQAEAQQTKISIERAYELFESSLEDFRFVRVLSYTTQAEQCYRQWRQQGIRISTHDLRIAAICVSYSAVLVSRNRRDFGRVPGLQVDFWE